MTKQHEEKIPQIKSSLVIALGLADLIQTKASDVALTAYSDLFEELRRLFDPQQPSYGPASRQIHQTVQRPWGTYLVLEQGQGYKIKRIEVAPKGRLSLQKHRYRSEHWFVVRGNAVVQNGETKALLKSNQSIFIPIGELHRLENPDSTPLQIIEVQRGSYLEEDDIERFDDLYERA